MTPPAIIHELVARFGANLDSYKRGIYNETQVRREFIDPFFEALGWGVSKLRILDPACGSGSFLLGAYQFLLDWHRARYIADGPEKWAGGRTPRLYEGRGGDWQLTIDERKRILLNNLFGVDIDPQAVEVSKLSLLLKVLEGEDEQTVGRQLALFEARVLPDLGRNIQCGNSLLGPDFYAGRQLGC